MAWPVYTERFVAATTLNAWTSYTVPAGKRAIVMSVIAGNANANSASVYAQAGPAYLMYAVVPGHGTLSYTELRLAIYPGEQISAQRSSVDQTVVVGGYLFNVAPGKDLPPEALEGDPPDWVLRTLQAN